jgi:hypothetical protein
MHERVVLPVLSAYSYTKNVPIENYIYNRLISIEIDEKLARRSPDQATIIDSLMNQLFSLTT